MLSIHSSRCFSRSLSTFTSLVALACIAPAALAQNRFASQVVDYSPGSGGGVFVAANILGGPTGEGLDDGSLDVASLGRGGSITVGFDVTITDGPGADLTVFENPFVFNGEVFSEVAYVEASTDGVHFARFPSSYAGPSTGFSGFTAPWGTYSGLTGCVPVMANVMTNTVDPFDPAVSGGESFDLASLAGDPLVVAGLVDIHAIHFVRIVDPGYQVGTDSFGHIIYDNSGPTGSADIDAVAVINFVGNVTASQPDVELSFDAQGFLTLTLTDPQGFADLDRTTFAASFDLAPLTLDRLRRILPVTTRIQNGIQMRSLAPVLGSGLRGVLSVSIRDMSGQFSGQQLFLQG